MKNLCLLLSICFTVSMSAQTVTIMESEKVMSKGLNNAASIELSDISEREVENWWKEYMRTYTKKMKKDRKTKEWFADDVSISEISGSTPVDVYTTVEGAGKYVVVSTWVESGDNYISSTSNPESYSGLENLMLGFDHYVGVEKINLELAEEEKTLKKLEQDLKKLKNQNDSYHKEIENAEAKIAKAEENIVQNEELQETTQKSIEDQMSRVEDVRIKLDDKKKEKVKN